MLIPCQEGEIIARCDKSGATLARSRKQYTLVYRDPARGIYETRHWSRTKVDGEEILARANRSLQRILKHYGGS